MEKLKKLNWQVVHECDEDDGTPTCWSAEINDPRYGKYVWICDIGSGLAEKGFNIEVQLAGGIKELKQCKSLASAKRWVTTQILNKNM